MYPTEAMLLVNLCVAHLSIKSSNVTRDGSIENVVATSDSTMEVEHLELSIFPVLAIWLEKMGEFLLEVNMVLEEFSSEKS